MPLSRRSLAALISTIAAFTAMPESATTPYMVNRLSGFSVIISPATTPVKTCTVLRIING